MKKFADVQTKIDNRRANNSTIEYQANVDKVRPSDGAAAAY